MLRTPYKRLIVGRNEMLSLANDNRSLAIAKIVSVSLLAILCFIILLPVFTKEETRQADFRRRFGFALQTPTRD